MIKGNDLIIATVNGQTVTPIASARSCDVYEACDLREVSSPSSSVYRTYVAGRKTWQVTVNYLLLSGVTAKLGAVGTSYQLSMYVRNNYNGDRVGGTAILKEARITGTRGNLLQGSWVFQGSGDLT